ncbi:DNA-binding protein [Undibacterium jejuense]|uniref:DNA-binding protein n=1 Tax=Undibacterium jejuense TaxID=1344949 RepID=A0A923KPY4_9BURK|nr:DNA-binding protein [Undibacterium jejuense]MBC3862226.1 DNA-binding protein [Undibacterium jejuense]
MARSGVLFSDVCRAAQKIQQSGAIPTVDSVRQVMGNTGSKSTISPMLKRWKEENQEELKAVSSGLPEAILNAVRGVYELTQAEAANEISEMRIQHQKELEDARTNLAQLKAEADDLSNCNKDLAQQLKDIGAEKNKLTVERQNLQLQLATMQSDNVGMQGRISDSENQLKALHQQLHSSRAQFEHYQQASTNQRNEEREAFNLRINRLEQDLKLARMSNAELQNHTTKQTAEIQQLLTSQSRMKEIAQVQLEELSRIENLQNKTQFTLEEMQAVNNKLAQTLKASQSNLHETQISLAISIEKQELLKQQLHEIQLKDNKLEREQLELLKTIVLQQQIAANNSNPQTMNQTEIK